MIKNFPHNKNVLKIEQITQSSQICQMRKGPARWPASTFLMTRLTCLAKAGSYHKTIRHWPTNSTTRDNGWGMAPPDGELAHSTAQNSVGIYNRDGKTENNQTDPNPKRQPLLGLNNPPYRGRTTNLVAPVSGTEYRLPLTILSQYLVHSRERYL